MGCTPDMQWCWATNGSSARSGAFVDQLKQHRVALTGDRLSLRSPYGKAQLTWREGLRVGSRQVPHEYPRYKSRQVSAERFPQAIPVRGDEHLLLLDWDVGSREDLPITA
ncbi:Hypothetical protein PFR_JS14_153 [Propionibacterium freudenreichii]|uniref:hypothetical protein n=1 Tax=Propionibacterium freudenreichii TaxID=1744 RepID=UPI000BC2F42D|nr:hypothetical protein [Propionibacterium freudenreichii]SBT28290.1 Hypothetical protein PFR_JS14_153 [Propionibacterium freudenreichii]